MDSIVYRGATERVKKLRSLECIREQCKKILELGKLDKLKHFRVHEKNLDAAALFVKDLMDKDYPDYDTVPFHSRWRHFEACGIDRLKMLLESWSCEEREEARRLVDLVVASVLLDAGAGDRWKYTEKDTAFVAGRSEGLGVASFHMFCDGAFSSDVSNPHQVDSNGLRNLSDSSIKLAFQATDENENPLVGCEGRTQVLKQLGSALLENPHFFEKDGVYRPGNMVDYLFEQADDSNCVSISALWKVIMYGFESMWPSNENRVALDGKNMGDVWKHSCLESDETGFIPFHKLSQWMTYSLIEPLTRAGLVLCDTELLTGLPEYRNGGFLIEIGVLAPKYANVMEEPHFPEEEVIVEWRALTVALLDEIYKNLLVKINKSQKEFPLVKMLEGGTWKAGRVLAKQRDPIMSSPPIKIISDGTVF